MNQHPAVHDVRILFDWRNAATGADAQAHSSPPAPVGNGDLELALQLLACNSRDRELFGQARAGLPSSA